MDRRLALARSSIGLKITMAVTGLVLFLFVVGHMLGNLKAFEGPAAFDAYAEFLREMGTPLVGRGQMLWLVRVVLLLSVVAHIAAAVELTRTSRAARPVGYRRRLSFQESTYASRTMRWGGAIIAAFVVYHLLHLTVGSAHPDFVPGSVYHNVVAGFRSPVVSGAYLVALAALMLHLYHGLWSVSQTLGVSRPRYERYRRPLAAGIALALFVGFSAVPVAVLTGVLR